MIEMIFYALAALLYVVVGILAYKEIDGTKVDRVWLAVVWPVLLPLYVIHWLHNGK